MVDRRFLRPGLAFKTAHLVEEIGEALGQIATDETASRLAFESGVSALMAEVLQAAGKTFRFGLDSIDPTLDPAVAIPNRAWLKIAAANLRTVLDGDAIGELADVFGAADRVVRSLDFGEAWTV